jgi:hypothetical protein
MENQYGCEQVVPIEQEPRHRRIGPIEFVRVFLVEIAPHERTLCHHHAHDYVMYVMGDAQIVSMPRDGEPMTRTYRDGDCEMSTAGLVHVVENLGDTKFRSVLVELLPGLDELQRGSEPRIVAGDGAVNPIFEEERLSVWSLEMKLDAGTEMHGPAILATFWEERVLPKGPGDINAKLNQVGNVSWWPSGRRVIGCDRMLGVPMKAVVFQLGRREGHLASVRKRTNEPIKSLRAHTQEPE